MTYTSLRVVERDKGIKDLVPPKALIVVTWLRGFVQERKVHVP
jgi:hypothetical protein